MNSVQSTGQTGSMKKDSQYEVRQIFTQKKKR